MTPRCTRVTRSWWPGEGWVSYPLRAFAAREMTFAGWDREEPTGHHRTTVVWSGPGAYRPTPLPWHRIPRARLLWMTIPTDDAIQDSYIRFLTGMYEDHNDCILWLESVEHRPDGKSVVRWKRWDR